MASRILACALAAQFGFFLVDHASAATAEAGTNGQVILNQSSLWRGWLSSRTMRG